MSILILPPTEEQVTIALLRAEVSLLRAEVNELANRIAAWPEPARDGWERHSGPDFSAPLQIVQRVPDPITEEMDFSDPQLLKPCDPNISKIEYDGENIVVFDQDGKRLEELCGTFGEVGLDLLARGGGLEWEMVPCPTQKLSLAG